MGLTCSWRQERKPFLVGIWSYNLSDTKEIHKTTQQGYKYVFIIIFTNLFKLTKLCCNNVPAMIEYEYEKCIQSIVNI